MPAPGNRASARFGQFWLSGCNRGFFVMHGIRADSCPVISCAHGFRAQARLLRQADIFVDA